MRLIPLAIAALLAAAPIPAFAERPVQFADQPPADAALVLPVANEASLGVLDRETREAAQRVLASEEFGYKLGEVMMLRGVGSAPRLLLVGTGDEPLELHDLQRIGAIAARETASSEGPVALLAQGLAAQGQDAAVQLALGARLAGYRFDRYKFADPADPRSPALDAPLTIIVPEAFARHDAFGRRVAHVAEAVAFTRDLVNEPGNALYPEEFVARTEEALAGLRNVEIEVLDVADMERLGMGSLLSVGRGSVRPPRMMIVHYRGAGGAPVVLAGKGITFDSGGISLKPSAGMWEMKGDMAGAAAVVGTVLALAKSEAPVHAIAIAALAENMPGGSATRPGDVVRAMNGKTIEILNTDAEGRLVLADAVAYAEARLNPVAIIDVATLTGSKVSAVGNQYAALFTEDDALAAALDAAGEASGEPLWRLPLHEDFAALLDSDIADIKNVAANGPGASIGAHFIQFFAGDDTRWAHLDIAGNDMSGGEAPTNPVGATGYGVQLLERFVRAYAPVAGQ